MKIVADKDIPFVQRIFSSIGDVTLADARQITPELVNDTDILIVRTVTNVNDVLLQGSSLKFVASATSGIDHIDTHTLQSKGIGFAHAPGCNARSVAEYILSVLFVLAQQYEFKLTEKSVGLIGCGHVGSQVLDFLQALGVSCIAHDPPLRDSTGNERYRSLDEVMTADIISLHVPLVTVGQYPTRHLISSEFLQGLRKDAILINTSRGQVIDETALLNFLGQNKQARVVLDVWADEPQINTALLSKVNIGTAHIAGYSTDGKLRTTQAIYQQTCDYFDIECQAVLPKDQIDAVITDMTLSDVNSDIDAVQLAVLASYDVRSDAAILRSLLAIDEAQRTDFFSEIRNTYPVRREFNAVNIKLAPASASAQEKLTLLGFNVTAANNG